MLLQHTGIHTCGCMAGLIQEAGNLQKLQGGAHRKVGHALIEVLALAVGPQPPAALQCRLYHHKGRQRLVCQVTCLHAPAAAQTVSTLAMPAPHLPGPARTLQQLPSQRSWQFHSAFGNHTSLYSGLHSKTLLLRLCALLHLLLLTTLTLDVCDLLTSIKASAGRCILHGSNASWAQSTIYRSVGAMESCMSLEQRETIAVHQCITEPRMAQ